MENFVSTIILATLSNTSPIPNTFIRQAIVNGEPVDGETYPWMVSLRAEYPGYVFDNTNTEYFNRFCGGSLIYKSPPIILTAAHCLDMFSNTSSDSIADVTFINNQATEINLFADLGRTKGPHIDNDHDETNDSFITLNITNYSMIHIHESWDTNAIFNGYDIALIIVDDGLQTLPNDQVIANIPRHKLISSSCCDDDEKLTVLGYGLDDDEVHGGEPTDTLEKITMEYHPPNDCVSFLNTYFNDDFTAMENDRICAMGNNTDVCSGDSGGPLFRILNDNDVEIVGITSFTVGNDTSGDYCNSLHPDTSLPSVFTSVAHYNDWIIQNGGMPSQSPTSSPSITPTKAPVISSTNGVDRLSLIYVYCLMFVLILVMID